MNKEAAVEMAVSAVAPISGISFGKIDDARTWVIRFLPTATQDEKTAAANVLATWDDLPQVKADTKARIDREAEAERLRYITAGAGQALEYNEAAEEAVRYAATGGAGAYPMLQASVDAGEAADLAAAAALITSRENAWATIGAEIRRLRLTAKRAVDAATTVEQVQAAATVTWP